MRIGLGIDTHQLIPGKLIRLGGVDIPSDVSIKAHSDGDIIYHAIADSILGAIGAGDIGDHFPDTDPKNKDLDSEVIVRLAIEKALSMNLILNNLDVTLLLESPKISDYKNEIKENLIKIFMEATKGHYTNNMFNIKASTSESLGFIGKGEGVTCYCITSLEDL
jgi:2-C-methyl-D-erythritol 2,4-cyclodiphosphate synthase